MSLTTTVFGNKFVLDSKVGMSIIDPASTSPTITALSTAFVYNVSITGTNMAGQLYFELAATGGTEPVLDDNYCEVSFYGGGYTGGYTNQPVVVLTPASAEAGDLIYESSYYIYATNTNFKIVCGNTIPSTAQVYFCLFNYMVIGT